MLCKKGEGERFGKVVQKLTSGSQKSSQSKQPSVQTSFYQEHSIRSQKSTKYGSQLQTPSFSQMDEARALRVLGEERQVLVNREASRLRLECVPTSNGMRYIILMAGRMVNLSWVHSLQEVEAGKILVLYYDLRGIGEGKAKMESLIVEGGQGQSGALYAALAHLHGKYHDEEVEKLYHSMC